MKINLSLNYSFDIDLELVTEESIELKNEESKDVDFLLEENVLPLDLSIAISDSLDLIISEGSGGILPAYTGSYNVIPKVKSQKLETKNKSMTNDINVEKIPYSEVSNPEGGKTIVIGGEL